jgi:hypothetical protein
MSGNAPQGRHGQLDLVFNAPFTIKLFHHQFLRRQQFERDTEPLRRFFAILENANVDRGEP